MFRYCGRLHAGIVHSGIPTPAPRNDITFKQKLHKYAAINRNVAVGALQKLLGHLWYLSEELIGLAFFELSIDCQREKSYATIAGGQRQAGST